MRRAITAVLLSMILLACLGCSQKSPPGYCDQYFPTKLDAEFLPLLLCGLCETNPRCFYDETQAECDGRIAAGRDCTLLCPPVLWAGYECSIRYEY